MVKENICYTSGPLHSYNFPYSPNSEDTNAASAAARTQLRGNGICWTSRAKSKSKHRHGTPNLLLTGGKSHIFYRVLPCL